MKKNLKKAISFLLVLTLTFTAFTAASEDKETSPVSISVSAACAKLSVPTGFKITQSGGNVKITWKKVNGADAYAGGTIQTGISIRACPSFNVASVWQSHTSSSGRLYLPLDGNGTRRLRGGGHLA